MEPGGVWLDADVGDGLTARVLTPVAPGPTGVVRRCRLNTSG